VDVLHEFQSKKVSPFEKSGGRRPPHPCPTTPLMIVLCEAEKVNTDWNQRMAYFQTVDEFSVMVLDQLNVTGTVIVVQPVTWSPSYIYWRPISVGHYRSINHLQVRGTSIFSSHLASIVLEYYRKSLIAMWKVVASTLYMNVWDYFSFLL